MKQEEKRSTLSGQKVRDLWDKEYTILCTVAEAMLKDKDIAQEAVHEAFLSLQEVRLREITPRAVRLYMLGVIKHHAQDIKRKQWRESAVTHQFFDESEVLKKTSPPAELPATVVLADMRKKGGQGLSVPQKKLFYFLTNHVDIDPHEHWYLWAKENDFDPTDRRRRNTFDHQKERLRNKLYANGLYQTLKE